MAANEPEPSRLLSIQSHVVSGYVGNRSATFPLQLLGWDVDVINTVQFSNHTGYGRMQGLRFDEEHVRSLFSGLELNGLLKQSRALSGYMPNAGVVAAVRDGVKRLKEVNPDLVYLCDPVMGDMDKGLYVDPSVLPMYKSILPLATITTPNQFEAQLLTEQEITDIPSLVSVLRALHDQGAMHVLITSVELPAADLERIGATPRSALSDGTEVSSMILVGSSRTPEDGSDHMRPWYIQFPEIPEHFRGVGDLFAALTLGRFAAASGPGAQQASSATETSDVSPIARATELSIASVQGVLAKTMASPAFRAPLSATQDSSASPEEREAEARVERMRRRELRIISSRSEIESPVVRHRAKFIPLP
ncbi:unnamed protein product [Parajaminaea phylloscopi]